MLTVLIVVGLFGLFALLMAKFYMTDTSRMTSTTTGRVRTVEERVDHSDDTRFVETRLIVTYVAGGREQTLDCTLPGARAKSFPVGRPVPVRYNPGDPHLAELISR